MNNQDLVVVFDSSGQRGQADLAHLVTNEQDEPQVLVKFDGQLPLLVYRALLSLQADGTYLLPWSITGLFEQKSGATSPETVTVPVIEETVTVAKNQVETARLRIKKVVHEHQETVDLPLLTEELDVQRIERNQLVTEPASMHQEGDTLIIPVYEEVLVVQKQLWLKEEVHIRKRQTEHRQPEQITLRKEEILVEPVHSAEVPLPKR